MAEPIYAFSSKAVRDKLAKFAQTLAPGYKNKTGLATPPPQQTRIFKATITTEITAATGGDAGTDFTVGSGEVYLLQRDKEVNENDLLWWDRETGDDKRKITVYNPYRTSFPESTKDVISLIQDRKGDYWILPKLGRGVIALTPSGGIPARNGVTPGSATCPLYRINSATDLLEAKIDNDGNAVSKKIYNTFATAITGTVYIVAVYEDGDQLVLISQDCS